MAKDTQGLDSTVSELDEKYKASAEVRRPFEGGWFLNLAYFVGNQWVSYDGNMIFEPELEDWRAKLVDNRILPSIRREIAKMTKAKPVWVGVPKDSSDEEIAAARLREQAFEHYWRELKMGRKLRQGLRWSRICTAGFLKQTWDSTKGRATEVLVDENGDPHKDEYGRLVTPERFQALPEELRSRLTANRKRVAMGEPSIEVRTPFEIFPDPLADENGLESAEWVIEEAVYSPGYVRSRYGVDVPPDAYASAGIAESRMARAIGQRASTTYKGVKLREFWAPPGSEFQNGKRCVWTAAGELLLEDDSRYPWLPYVMLGGIQVPGRFWPTSIAEQERSPQTERNKRLSQMSENADRIGNPPLRIAASALENDDIDDWQGLPGEKLVFDDTGTPNAAPDFLHVPELPAYVQNLLGLTDEAMREISSQHEVSAASVPAGVTAASAINLLLEQDDTVLGPDIDDMSDALTDAGQHLLWMLSSFASDERMLRIAGPEGLWDFKAWQGSDLGDCSYDTVQIGSGVPQSKAAKQAALQDVLNMIVQSRVPVSERNLRQFLQEYQVAGLEKLFANIGEDERQIQRENQLLAEDAELDINEYDDDSAHVHGHQAHQKGASYEQYSPDVKARFEEHVALHKQRMTDAAAAMAAGGAGDGPTGPPADVPGANGSVPSPGVVPSQP